MRPAPPVAPSPAARAASRARIRLALAAALMALPLVAPGPAPAQQACYADYKAKRDGPLRLHYGVMQVPSGACDPDAAAAEIARRLGDGWQLLDVVSVFGPEGLEERRESAGDHFLRY
jgi:hypothetical protein